MKYERWLILETDDAAVEALMDAGYPYLVSTVLASRGVVTPEQAAAHLDRERSLVYSPFLMRDMDKAVEWSRSPHVYTCRFGLAMLMSHFLDSRFSPSVLDTAAAVESDEYYVRMMVAWFFATALAKQWDAAIPYLQQRRLGVWVHNKTIQKACESYRITAGQKAVLRTMKITKANDRK